jgi:hypothetical protein
MPATRNEANDQSNRAGNAGQHATEEAARAARAVTDEAAKVGEQTARAGADMARRGVETARENLEAGLDTAAQSFRRMTDQVTKVLGFNGPQAEELARRSSQNLQAVSQANTVLARGFQEASHEWISLAQERVTKNIDDLNRLAGCRSVQDFVAVQSDLVRDNLGQIIDTNKRIAELSLRVAEEAAGIVQTQVGKTADAARRVAH